jgi:hypothetical protein
LDSEEGKRYVDKLVKVYLKDGKDKWVLIHIEVQGYRDTEFSERMFKYFYRIYDKYNEKILAIAILTDSIEDYKPSQYDYEFYDTRLAYTYRMYKVIEQDEEKLLKEENPFALAVLAAKYAIKSKNDDEKKIKFKLKLIRLLFSRGYNREEIISIFRFIDGIMKINDVMKEKLFKEEVMNMEEVKRVPYITSIERIAKEEGLEKGMKKGIEKGMLKSTQENVIDVIEAKFDEVPKDIAKKVKEIDDIDILKDLLKKAIKSETLDKFRNELKSIKEK